MKILVTGGGGFLGQALCRGLVERGHQVVSFNRGHYPALAALNLMGLKTPQSAILSAVIFNALIIVCLIPLALKGVRYRAVGAARALRDNLLLYGLGGLVTPFLGIKAIDMLLVALQLHHSLAVADRREDRCNR